MTTPLTCGGTTATTPIGGQGQSARCSKVFFVKPTCGSTGTGILLNGTGPSGPAYYFSEQVTRIEIRSRVSMRKYGHDKSYCAQDSTKGIASWDGSLQTKVQCCTPAITVQAGALIWLQVYPLGLENVSGEAPVISGYAEIEEDPIICNLENGDPVEHNYTYSSKGWWNMPTGISGTFDCCGCCDAGGGGSDWAIHEEASIHAEAARLGGLTQSPVTVYQWTDKGEWHLSYDECSGEFMPGPMPKNAGKFVGEMKFVKCMAA